MSELQTHECWVYDYGCRAEMVGKPEVDRLIAELEENHKKEVGQLLILNREQTVNANRLRDSMERIIRFQKYKRCVAKAEMCGVEYDRWLMKKANAIGLGKDGVEYYLRARRKCFHYMRWQLRWLKIAGKFKEAKNDQN